MSKFLTYQYDSGEIFFIKREAINSFHPVYTHGKGYTIFVTDGISRLPIKRADSMEEAVSWIEDQILLIDKEGKGKADVVSR